MFVYSGEYRFCKVGIETTLIDDSNNVLRTGDIVMSYTVSEDLGVVYFDGLTVVVSDDFINIFGKIPEKKVIKSNPFIMGIKNSKIDEPMKKYPSEVWRVRRLKKYEDVIDGEHWKDFGFRYSNK